MPTVSKNSPFSTPLFFPQQKVMFATHNGDTLGVDGVATKLVLTRDHDLVTLDDAGKIMWSSKTGGKGEGKATLALGDNGILVLVDESEHAIWHTGPHGLKALLANLKAGATFLGDRAAYYASTAYAKARALAETAVATGKTTAADVSTKVRETAADASAKAAAAAADVSAKASAVAADSKAAIGKGVDLAKEKAAAASAAAGDFAHAVKDKTVETAHAAAGKADAIAAQVKDRAAEFAHK